MYTLAIDTSNDVLGVAIMKEQQVIGEFVTNMKKNHSVRLMPAIDQLMKEIAIKPDELEKIIVAKGPGSYTGVRIGLTTAKTLAWGLNIPIIGVSSLEVLAYQGRFFQSYICPFFDARRGLVYTGLFQWENNQIESVFAEQNILMTDWLQKLSELKKPVLFLSPNINMYDELITDQLQQFAVIPEGAFHIPKPTHLAIAGSKHQADHVHSLTPNYLRLAEAEANWQKKQQGKENHG